MADGGLERAGMGVDIWGALKSCLLLKERRSDFISGVESGGEQMRPDLCDSSSSGSALLY